jgi:hypothetical protein
MILPVIFSAASLILCGFFFVYFRAWLGSRVGRDEKLTRYREEVNRLIVAIDAATDRDASIAEDRIQTLKSLIVEADARINALLVEQEKQKDRRALQARAAYAEMGRNRLPPDAAVPEAAASAPVAGPPGALASVPASAQAGEASGSFVSVPADEVPGALASVPASVPAGGAPGSPVSVPAGPAAGTGQSGNAGLPSGPRSFSGMVAELAAGGLSAELIAQKLGAPLSEIDLALKIRGSRPPGGRTPDNQTPPA